LERVSRAKLVSADVGDASLLVRHDPLRLVSVIEGLLDRSS
jgi:hypothetical protein